MEERRRITASGIAFALVAVMPLGPLALWWISTLPDEPELDVGRHVFGNIPDAVIALFYVGVAAFLGLATYLFAVRVKNWERGLRSAAPGCGGSASPSCGGR